MIISLSDHTREFIMLLSYWGDLELSSGKENFDGTKAIISSKFP